MRYSLMTPPQQYAVRLIQRAARVLYRAEDAAAKSGRDAALTRHKMLNAGRSVAGDADIPDGERLLVSELTDAQILAIAEALSDG